MAIDHVPMHMPSQQIDPRQKADGAMTNVLMVPPPARVLSHDGRQVRGRDADGLNAGFLVVTHDGDHAVFPRLSQQFDFRINTKDFRHFSLEFLIAPFQVILNLVRANLGPGQDLRHGAAAQFLQRWMSVPFATPADMSRQQVGCPQFVRIPKFLRLLARQRGYPCLGIVGDARRMSSTGQVRQRRQGSYLQRLVQAPLDAWSIRPQRASHRRNTLPGRIFQQNSCSVHSMPRLCSRSTNQIQLPSRFLVQYQRCPARFKRHVASLPLMGGRLRRKPLHCNIIMESIY
jgi:hypothetical protein